MWGGGGVCRLKPKINMALNKAKNGYIPVSNLGVDTHNCANNYLVIVFFGKGKTNCHEYSKISHLLAFIVQIGFLVIPTFSTVRDDVYVLTWSHSRYLMIFPCSPII